jgi:nucleoid DNA-binding protein
MIAIEGIYENGKIRLNRKIQTKKAMKVVVTFLEDNDQNNNRLSLEDFSFLKSRKKKKRYKGSISDSVLRKEGLTYENIFRYLLSYKTLSRRKRNCRDG